MLGYCVRGMHLFLTLIFCLVCSCYGVAETVHNVAADWSLQNGNPNGHWAYGSYQNEDIRNSGSFFPFGEGLIEPNVGVEIWWAAGIVDPNVSQSCVLCHDRLHGDLLGQRRHWI